MSHTTALLILSILLRYYIHTTAFCALAGYIKRTPSFHEESEVTWNCEWRAPSLAEKIHAKIHAKIHGIFRKQQVQYLLLTTTDVFYLGIIAHFFWGGGSWNLYQDQKNASRQCKKVVIFIWMDGWMMQRDLKVIQELSKYFRCEGPLIVSNRDAAEKKSTTEVVVCFISTCQGVASGAQLPCNVGQRENRKKQKQEKK